MTEEKPKDEKKEQPNVIPPQDKSPVSDNLPKLNCC